MKRGYPMKNLRLKNELISKVKVDNKIYVNSNSITASAKDRGATTPVKFIRGVALADE